MPIYGYLNRVQLSRRLERETQRNLELIWLTGRLSPDFKTIADFRKMVPKPLTTPGSTTSRYDRRDFKYSAEDDEFAT